MTDDMTDLYADAITECLKAGMSMEDLEGGGLAGVIALGLAGQISVSDAAPLSAMAIEQFKLGGKDIPALADILTNGGAE